MRNYSPEFKVSEEAFNASLEKHIVIEDQHQREFAEALAGEGVMDK